MKIILCAEKKGFMIKPVKLNGPESTVTAVWSLCHQSDLGGHRGLEGTLSKFLIGFFLIMSKTENTILEWQM